MAITRVTAGEQASIDDLNQLIDLLEGTSGYDLAFFLRCIAASNFTIRLADNAGVRVFLIQDSDGATVATINSNGDLDIEGTFTPGVLMFPTSTSAAPTTEGQAIWDSDDDVLRVGDGSTTKTLRDWGTPIIKAADETVNGSDTLQNDDDFAPTVAANTDYLVEMNLLLSTGTTPDWKFAWTLTGMTWTGSWVNVVQETTSYTYDYDQDVASAAAKTVTVSTAATATLWKATFVIHAGSTGGTLNFQWAQGTSDASNTKVLKNSSMTIRRLGAT